MAGIEMQNAVIVALILLVFFVYQYYPSFMKGEGFSNIVDTLVDKLYKPATQADHYMKILRNAHGSEPPGFTSFPGKVQAYLTGTTPYHINPVPWGDPQSIRAMGNELKIQPKELDSYGPDLFGPDISRHSLELDS
jgi:hypothetical protein